MGKRGRRERKKRELLGDGLSISEVSGGKVVDVKKVIGSEDTRNLEKELMNQIDVGILESITDELNIVQVNLAKKHGWDELGQYMAEGRLQADVILCQEPPLL